MKKRQRHTEKGSGRCVRRALVWVIALLLTALAVYLLLSQLPKDDIDVDALLKESSSIPIETEAPETETEHVNSVPYPDIDEQLLTVCMPQTADEGSSALHSGAENQGTAIITQSAADKAPFKFCFILRHRFT